jgi:histidine triad (HIT) family protein
MTDPCVFCRIAKREFAAHVIHEDERILAFLDRGAIRPGHTQIIPKEHYAYFDDTPAEIITSIVLVAQQLATAMKQLYSVPRVAFLFTGGDVAHVHAHVVPMQEDTDITSRRYIEEENLTFRPLQPTPDVELAQTTIELRRAFGAVRRAIIATEDSR